MRFSSVVLCFLAFLGQYIVCGVLVPSRCPVVRLTNGRVRARARGRVVRFVCYEGFTLVGNKYSTCVRGQWDTPTPVCVNAACPAPPTPDHALMASKYNGAILMYFCEPGYVLIGPSEIYCDGVQWNGTAPHCRDTSAAAPTQCDFEKPDICWWEQDPKHDFDWQRHNFETPSVHIGTGPSHDHTLGPGNDGYYLYIEASGRLVSDSARIISPLYNASYTESGCFSFWYHMFGATIGALHVYFKPELGSTPKLMFSTEGNHGNQWLHGVFDLPRSNQSFQIIIEGVRGSSYVSDIAIDDVAILQGDKCNVNKTEATEATQSVDDQIEVVNAQLSCRGRCKNTASVNFTVAIPPTPTDSCLCTLDCAELSVCCPDYAEYCVLALPEEPQSTEGWTYPNVAVAATTEYIYGHVVSIIPKDDIDPVTSKPATITTVGPVTTALRMKTETPFRTTRRTTPRVVVIKDNQTKETPFMQATTVARRYVHPDEQLDPKMHIQDPAKLHRDTERFSLPGIIGVVVGILTGVSITMMVAFFIVRRRKTYKRKTGGSALSEDSDVRFLTSDEILDFTLARPNENDDS